MAELGGENFGDGLCDRFPWEFDTSIRCSGLDRCGIGLLREHDSCRTAVVCLRSSLTLLEFVSELVASWLPNIFGMESSLETAGCIMFSSSSIGVCLELLTIVTDLLDDESELERRCRLREESSSPSNGLVSAQESVDVGRSRCEDSSGGSGSIW